MHTIAGRPVPQELCGLRDTAGEFESSGQFTLDRDFSGHEVSLRNNFVQRDFDTNRIAWSHHLLELDAIEPGSDGHGTVLRSFASEQNRAGLESTFAEDDTGDEWEVWEMTLQKKLVARKPLGANDLVLGLLDYLVYKEHGGTMRNKRFDCGFLQRHDVP